MDTLSLKYISLYTLKGYFKISETEICIRGLILYTTKQWETLF